MHNSQQKAMLAIDGVGFDWSDMAEEQVQTNMALMAFSDSKVYNDKTCLKNYETLKKQCDDLIVKLNQTEFTATTYKIGLATLEEQLITSRKNEFPTQPLIYNRPKKLDLSYSGLYEFKEPEFKGSGSKNKQVSKVISSFVDSSLIVDKETIFPVDKKVESVKPKNHEKPVKKSVSVNYNYTAKRTHPNAQRNMIPRAVLRKTGLKPFNTARTGKPQKDDIRFVDSGCSRHMTRNIVYLSDFKEFDGVMKHLCRGAHGGRITGKGTLKTDSLDFEDDTSDESRLWHRRLGHINFRNINKLVKDNLVRGLPTKRFENDQTCVLVLKGSNTELLVSPRFTWVFFLTNKDETNEILKNFIKEIENLVDKKVKIIRSDNGIEFKNKVLDDFCREKVAACTIINEYAGTQGELNAGTSEEISQDCTIEDGPDNENDEKDRHEDDSSPKEVNTAGQHVNTTSPEVNIGCFKLNTVGPLVNTASSYDQDSLKDMFTMGASHTLEATHVEFFIDEDEPEVDLGNITNSYTVPTTPNTRIHKDHPIENVIGDVKSFIEPTSIAKALSDSLGEASRRTFSNSDSNRFGYLWICLLERGPLEQNGSSKTRKMKGGLRLEIKKGWLHRVIDKKKSAFLYGTIEEEVYVTQPSGFKDPDHPEKVYRWVKTLYGLHQAPKAWYETLANYLLGNRFKRGKIDQTLFIKKQKGDIFLVQVYVDDIIFGSTNKDLCTTFEKLMKDKFQMTEILKKYNYTDVKSTSTLVDLEKPLVKDRDADDISSYTKDITSLSIAYTDSDYAGATQDRKSITGGCQFLGNKLILWQCKKQTMEATSTTEAEYVAAASCYGQVLWIQNQLLDYGYNFMNTVINIDNNNLLTKGFDAGRRVESFEDKDSLGDHEDASKQGRSIEDID
ncbi:putative ribonuclease H-like domain-containing protein [Tanacetum coccineum]